MANLLKEHFMNPLNLGKIKKSCYTYKNKSGFCGDTIETSLDISDGVINDAKYQACGCWALIGSASIFSEYLKGKKVEDILEMNEEDFLSLVGEFPEDKRNCIIVSKNGFINALKDGTN